jgi:AcrR family transcriptional regulator
LFVDVEEAAVSSAERSSMSAVREQRRAAREAPRLDTRGAVLAGLESVLSEESLHDVSVARILEAAGVSRVAFYSHFESKFEAAGALLTQVMDSVFEQWRPLRRRCGTGPAHGVLGGVTGVVRAVA